jgi:tetratricopeptide (TPR) repeat protein
MKQGTSDPELYGGLVVACRYCGLFEASLAADERARSLDPNVRTSVHYTYWMMGDYQRAHDHDDEPVAFVKNYALEALGREKEALASYRRWLADDYEGVERDIAVATIALFTRDYAGARAAARRVLESGFTDCEGLYFDARILVRAEALEEGLDLLGRVVRGGFTVPETMQRDPWLEPLRDEPRFRALIEEARAARNHAGDLLMRSGGGRLLGLDDATLMLDERAN